MGDRPKPHWQCASGAEGSVHLDTVLEYNRDPAYLADLALYELSVQARTRFESSGLSARKVARRLGTSPTQLYRLLDPTTKSLRQLFALLSLLGVDVDVTVDVTVNERLPFVSAAPVTG